VCPHCSSTSFRNKCPRCGGAYDGAICPACKKADEELAQANQAAWDQAAASAKANSGLGWKTVLTVFVPFVGGFFLIRKDVKAGYRVFAIAWCALMAFMMLFSDGGGAGFRLFSALACFAPIGVYLLTNKRAEIGRLLSNVKLPNKME